MNSKVMIHIEELVVHGLTDFDQTQLKVVVEQALAQMIGEQGLPGAWEQSHSMSSVNGGEIRPQGSVASLGQQIAQAVYGGYGR